eukprot:364639-Chlamydomonas_euryale.AAC.4
MSRPFLGCSVLSDGGSRSMLCSPPLSARLPRFMLDKWPCFWVVRLTAFFDPPLGGHKASADHAWTSFLTGMCRSHSPRGRKSSNVFEDLPVSTRPGSTPTPCTPRQRAVALHASPYPCSVGGNRGMLCSYTSLPVYLASCTKKTSGLLFWMVRLAAFRDRHLEGVC